jgi:hypothetical protein
VRQGQFDLRVAIGEIEGQRDQRGAGLLGLADEFDDLVMVQQEFAGSPRLVVRPRAVFVLRICTRTATSPSLIDANPSTMLAARRRDLTSVPVSTIPHS